MVLFLRRIRLLNRQFRTFDKHPLTTSSVAQKNLSPRREKILQTRILNFLERRQEIDENEPALVERQEHQLRTSASPTEHQNQFESDPLDNVSSEFQTLVTFIERHVRPQQNSTVTLSVIDDNCCKILRKLSPSKILELLRLLTKAWPRQITFLKFYRHSLNTLRKLLHSRELSTQETLELLFFEGLRKKEALHSVKFIINFLPPISALSLMEQCVVAHTAFKCAFKLKDVNVLQDVVEKNARTLVEDPALLVTLCKAVRHAGPTEDCSFENLSAAIVANTERFTIKCAAHVLALYSEAHLGNLDVLQRLFDDSMKDLSDEKTGRRKLVEPVEKDVDRLLWASGVLNYKLRSSDILEIRSSIDRRYENLSKKPNLFANILLSLWILNCRLKDVMEKCLVDKVFLPIIKEQVLWKSMARLQLLLSCARIEAPEIVLPDEIVRPHNVGMKIGKSVKRLHRLIDQLATQLEIDEINIDCPVGGIYIPGISFRLRKQISVHVDLLDKTSCLKLTTVPVGLMNLKLRLLSKIDFHSIVITEAQLENAQAASAIIEKCIEDIVQNKCRKLV